MKLHIYEHCPFCLRARLAFGLKDVPVEVCVIMEGDAETPTRMIGKKAVPILEKDDGSFMGESLDIVDYADKLGTPIFDGPGDEALDNWLKDAWSTTLNLLIPRFTKGEFAELATPEAREAYRLREEKAFGDLDALETQTQTYIQELAPKMDDLAQLLEGRDRLNISDVTLWPILRSLTIVKDFPFPDVVRKYTEKLAEQSGVPLLFEQANY